MGTIAGWVSTRGHEVRVTRLFSHDAPAVEDFDMLVVLGGPMNIYEEAEYPWLAAEKKLIAAAIDAGKLVIGICLGGQLIADVLGAPVTRAPEREIGWFPVTLTDAARRSPVFGGFPQTFPALHWHGDTFAIPDGAVHIAETEPCRNQAFEYDGGRVVAIQFHLQETRDTVAMLVRGAESELEQPGRWISSAGELLAPDIPLAQLKDLLYALLDNMAALWDQETEPA